MEHLVKVGLMGLVGRYRALDLNAYPRAAKVICRTGRGLEVGEVLCPVDAESELDAPSQSDGELLRQVGHEDELILERLERYRDRAYTACSQLLVERRLPGTLVDVEHLFDGESLFFYFLGDVDPRVEKLTNELAATYERKVRFKKFAETLAQGCGPECGTGVSCGSSGGCGTCALSGGCGSKK
jgi:hypothetical protein